MDTRSQTRDRVAFDTNMLMSIGQLKVDVFFEVRKMFGSKAELAVPSQVFAELKELSGQGKQGKNAGLALEAVGSHGVKVADVDADSADNALVKMAESGYVVASNDAALRKRIKGFGGKVIYLRQRRFLKTD